MISDMELKQRSVWTEIILKHRIKTYTVRINMGVDRVCECQCMTAGIDGTRAPIMIPLKVPLQLKFGLMTRKHLESLAPSPSLIEILFWLNFKIKKQKILKPRFLLPQQNFEL